MARLVAGLGPAWLWFGLHLVALMALPSGLRLLALSWVFLPAQSMLNRLPSVVAATPSDRG